MKADPKIGGAYVNVGTTQTGNSFLGSIYMKGTNLMNTQENKEFIRAYFEALSGKPKPPELVDE